MTFPELSVIIPVYNEEAGLAALFARLYPALDALALPYEVIFIDDGSRDRSAELLSSQHAVRSDVTRVLLLNGNYGQHMAILAGFEAARGEIVVTLDADLQNPPEEIGKLVAKMREGYDYVGTIRRQRQDSLFRRKASRAMNRLRESITHIQMTDQGCMLRAYSRRIISVINRCGEVNTFIPALAYTFARNPTEIEVAHEERFAGESKYSLYSLVRLNFDLVTGFSVVPLQWLSFAGVLLSGGSAALFLLLMIRRFIVGAEVQGVFTLFAITFFMLGVIVFALGLLGEYVGRIYQQVRARPRYVVQTSLDLDTAESRKQAQAAPAPRAAAATAEAALPAPAARPLVASPTPAARPRAVVFAYHDVGCRCLGVLLARGVDVALVVTHEDNPQENIWFGNVAALAAEHGIPVIKPESAQDPALALAVREAAPDFIFSFYYRFMLPSTLLALAARGAYNMHGSLLPKYRGRVPVNWAVLKGESETGATLHEMQAKPDAGAIVARTPVPILPDDTAHQVFQKVAVAAEQTLWEALPGLLAGNAPHLPNDLSAGSYFGARKPEDGRIDWQAPAQAVYNLVRAVAPPYPGAFTDIGGRRFVIARARLRQQPLPTSAANLPPGIHVVDNAFLGLCGDARAIDILELRSEERPVDADLFTQLTETGITADSASN